MQNGEPPLGWRGFLATNSDFITAAGAVMGVILFFIKMPPPIFFGLIGVAAAFLIVGIVGHVFISNAQPLENLGSIKLEALVDPQKARITEGAGRTLRIDSAGIGGTNEEAIAVSTESPSPNIVCLGGDELRVELVRDVFRQSGNHREALRAVVLRFSNEPDPPRKVGAINRAVAKILYYGCHIPTRELRSAQLGCWVNEESAHVSFATIGKEQNLVLGTLALEGSEVSGFGNRFTVYENNEDPSKPLTRWTYRNCFCLRILVTLIAGERGEYSRKDEFELKSEGVHFTVEQLTEEKKQERARRFVAEILGRVSFGEQLFARPVEDWKRFYRDAHEWRVRTWATIARNKGEEWIDRFHNVKEIRPYPHPPPQGSRQIVDEFYTQFLNLKDIAEELSQEPQNQRHVTD